MLCFAVPAETLETDFCVQCNETARYKTKMSQAAVVTRSILRH